MLNIGNFSFGFRSGLIGTIGASLIIALIAGLIVRLVRGTDFKQKDMKNAGLINSFLYVGSFMIVGSMLMFMQDYPDAMPIVAITGSLIALITGILLYCLVDFLRPVGLAFAYTGLAILPFWFFAFHELGTAPELAFFFAILASTIGYLLVAGLTRSILAGWISYLLLLIFGAALPITGKGLLYTSYLLPFLVALFALICWARRVKWLPVGFRQPSRALAYFAVPAILFFALPILLTEGVAKELPLLRSIILFLAVIHYLIAWLIEKKRSALVATRIIFQCFLIAVISDITGYALFSWGNNLNPSAGIAISIIWLVGSLIQTIISLFIPANSESDAGIEKAMLVVSLACIAFTPAFCQGLSIQVYGVIGLAMCAVIAILGILITIKKRNLNWGFATLVALLAAPFMVQLIVDAGWNYWAYYVIYAAISAIVLISYIGLRKVQATAAYHIALSGIIACAVIAVLSDMRWYSVTWPCVPFAVAAAELAILGVISQKKDCYELSAYSTATAVYFFVGSLAQVSPEASAIVNHPHYLKDSIFGLALGGSIMGVGLFREFGNKNSARQIAGYIIMTVIMLDAAASGHTVNSLVAPLILLFAQLISMILGFATDRKWLTIASACVAAFDVVFLMGSSNWLTFGIVGIVMIGIVIGILIRANNKPQQQ